MKPNATRRLIVTGDTTLEEIAPKLEKLFARWKPGAVPEKNLARVAPRSQAIVYLLDRPDSLQSIIFAGHLAPPTANPDEIAIDSMNAILGGSFTARVNMNLREDKHWAYGAYSFFTDARGQRPFIVYAPVQTDKTKEAMREIQKELADITGARPPSAEELARVKDKKTLTLPGRWETASAVKHSMSELVRFGYPDDFWTHYPEKVRALDLEQVSSAAQEVIHPERLIWVVVGDRGKIEEGIRELGLGEVRAIDADGNPIEGGATAPSARE